MRGGVEEALDAAGFGLEAAEEMFDERFGRRGHALDEGLGGDADAGVLVGGIGRADAVAQVGDETFVGDTDVPVRPLFADDQRRGAAVGTMVRDGGGDVAAGEDIAIPDDEVRVFFVQQASDVCEASAGLQQDRFMDELHFGVTEASIGEGERPGFGAVVRVD